MNKLLETIALCDTNSFTKRVCEKLGVDSPTEAERKLDSLLSTKNQQEAYKTASENIMAELVKIGLVAQPQRICLADYPFVPEQEDDFVGDVLQRLIDAGYNANRSDGNNCSLGEYLVFLVGADKYHVYPNEDRTVGVRRNTESSRVLPNLDAAIDHINASVQSMKETVETVIAWLSGEGIKGVKKNDWQIQISTTGREKHLIHLNKDGVIGYQLGGRGAMIQAASKEVVLAALDRATHKPKRFL